MRSICLIHSRNTYNSGPQLIFDSQANHQTSELPVNRGSFLFFLLQGIELSMMQHFLETKIFFQFDFFFSPVQNKPCVIGLIYLIFPQRTKMPLNILGA